MAYIVMALVARRIPKRVSCRDLSDGYTVEDPSRLLGHNYIVMAYIVMAYVVTVPACQSAPVLGFFRAGIKNAR